MADYVDKYCPQQLDQIIGQPVVVRQVQNMIRRKQIPHTILVTGPFGVGKTSIAKIMACMFNGLEYRNEFADLAEFNIGNLRGIDAVREIAAAAQYAPRGNYRIIILDELHRLTPAAAPALLESIERGPEQTIWLLVTAHPEQLLPEIIRRCYPLKLRQPTPQEIRPLLRNVAKRERLKFPDSKIIIRKIADMAQGQPATALHMLQAAGDASAPQATADEILSAALQASPTYATETLAVRCLVFIYRHKISKLITALPRELEAVPLGNALLNLNGWLLNELSGRRFWRSPITDNLRRYTQNVQLRQIIFVQNGLLSLRTEIQRFILPEHHLITARLAQLALEYPR